MSNPIPEPSVDEVLDKTIKRAINFYPDASSILLDIENLKEAAKSQLRDLLLSKSKSYTLRVNRSDGYEETERATPISAINELFGDSNA